MSNRIRVNRRINNERMILTEQQINLISIYENFYNQTSRQIQQLNSRQNDILDTIDYIIRMPNNYTREYEPENESEAEQRQTTATANSTTNSNGRRININGYPYTIDYEYYNIPIRRQTDTSFNNLFNNLGTNIINNSETQNNIVDNIINNFGNFNMLEQFYSNVPISPSNQQIINGTIVAPFCELINPCNNSCPITLETFENNTVVTQLRGCGHAFNSISIQSWFITSPRCPVCRYDIRNYIPTTQNFQPEAEAQAEESDQEDEEEEKEESTNTVNNTNSQSENISQERNLNPINRTNVASNLTGFIINELLGAVTRVNTNISTNRFLQDPSHNEINLERFYQ